MIWHLIRGGDPVETLLGAVVTAAVGAGAWRNAKAYAIGSIPAAIMYHVILYARPLAQAGVVVLASWFLLIGGFGSTASWCKSSGESSPRVRTSPSWSDIESWP